MTAKTVLALAIVGACSPVLALIVFNFFWWLVCSVSLFLIFCHSPYWILFFVAVRLVFYSWYWILPITALIFLYNYKYSKKYFRVWADQGIKYVAPKYNIGPLNIDRIDLMKDELDYYKNFGRIYGRFDGITPVLTVGERTLIDKIINVDFSTFQNRRDIRVGDPCFDVTLFALEGEDWRRVRNFSKKSFTPFNLKLMIPLLQECYEKMLETLRPKTENGDIVNCQEFISNFIIHSIARCGFGIKIENDDEFMQNASKLLEDAWKTYFIVFVPILMKYLEIPLLNSKSIDFYNRVMTRTMNKRKLMEPEEKKKHHDFLQNLLDSRKVGDSNNNNNSESSATISDSEILAQCVSFFLAGYETSVSLLSHCMYRLAMNQDCQERVITEIREVMQEDITDKDNYNDTYANIGKLKYLDCFIKECFRMSPPVVRMERRAEHDYIFEEGEIQIKKGYLVNIPVMAMHRDPEYYPEPEVFNPDRFYNCDRNDFKNIFFPFGAGMRICVGRNFADLQAKLCLVNIISQFHILPSPTTPENLQISEKRNVLLVDKVDVILRART